MDNNQQRPFDTDSEGNPLSPELIGWILHNLAVVGTSSQTHVNEGREDYDLLRTALQTTNGLSKGIYGSTCSPAFVMKQTDGVLLEEASPSIHVVCLKDPRTCVFGCFRFGNAAWKTLKYFIQGREIMSVIYKSYVWWGADPNTERLVDIYIPQRTERIGYIKFKGEFRNLAEIYNCVTGEVFVTRKGKVAGFSGSDGFCMEIVDSGGQLAAVAVATQGLRRNYGSWQWSNFQLKFSQNFSSVTTKALIMTAFNIMVIDYKEAASPILPTIIALLVVLAIAAAISLSVIYFASR